VTGKVTFLSPFFFLERVNCGFFSPAAFLFDHPLASPRGKRTLESLGVLQFPPLLIMTVFPFVTLSFCLPRMMIFSFLCFFYFRYILGDFTFPPFCSTCRAHYGKFTFPEGVNRPGCLVSPFQEVFHSD